MITVLDDRELKSAEDGGATALFAPKKQIELEVKLEVEGRRTDERSSRGLCSLVCASLPIASCYCVEWKGDNNVLFLVEGDKVKEARE